MASDSKYAIFLHRSDAVMALVDDADAKNVQANLKNQDEGSGKYFPILAANQFTSEGKFINGVYIPHVAALQFEGPYEWKKVSP